MKGYFMKSISALLVLLALCLPALPSRADEPSIDTAIAALEKQIARDEGIVARPANIAATRQARLRIGQDLNEFQFIINHFERHFAASDPAMIKDLHRIFDEEKADAADERYSHRYLDSTREMVKANLPVKKAILKRVRDVLEGK